MVQVAVTARIETTHHHGSHRRLIWAVESAPQGKVDAIFVPTFRRVAYLKDAASAARSLGCPLITLHSGIWTSAFEAAAFVDPAVDLIAIDVPEAARLRLPALDRMGQDDLRARTDLSTKRACPGTRACSAGSGSSSTTTSGYPTRTISTGPYLLNTMPPSDWASEHGRQPMVCHAFAPLVDRRRRSSAEAPLPSPEPNRSFFQRLQRGLVLPAKRASVCRWRA
jgi:hypothetical protein